MEDQPAPEPHHQTEAPDPQPQRSSRLSTNTANWLAAALLLGAGAGVGWAAGFLTKPVPKPTPAASQPSAASDTDQLTADLGPISKDQSGQLALSAPAAWRGLSLPFSCQENTYNETQFFNCSSLVFADTLGTKHDLTANNTLTYYDLTDWLKVDRTGGPDPISNVSKRSQKQAEVNYLLNLNKDSHPSSSDKDKVFQPTDAAYVTSLQQMQYVESSDGQLHGVAFIANIGQGPTYQPQAVIYLAGKSGLATFGVLGFFQLNDKRSQDLKNQSTSPGDTLNIQDAMKRFDDGQLDDDTKASFDQVVSTVKTLKLQLTQTAAQH